MDWKSSHFRKIDSPKKISRPNFQPKHSSTNGKSIKSLFFNTHSSTTESHNHKEQPSTRPLDRQYRSLRQSLRQHRHQKWCRRGDRQSDTEWRRSRRPRGPHSTSRRARSRVFWWVVMVVGFLRRWLFRGRPGWFRCAWAGFDCFRIRDVICNECIISNVNCQWILLEMKCFFNDDSLGLRLIFFLLKIKIIHQSDDIVLRWNEIEQSSE